MGKLVIVFLLCALASAKAALYPALGGGVVDQEIAVINQAFTSNSVVTVTNDVSISLNHTIQMFVTASGTNSAALVVSASVDNTNFVSFGTMTATNSQSISTNFTGQYKSFRLALTVTGTNATPLVNYIGGR